MPWLIVVLGYFLGSIPTAYIAGRVLKGVDIRGVGDGNMGAANAFRQLGTKVGVAVGIIDATKGAVAVLIAQAASLPLVAVLLTGTATVVGHNWPIFIGFRGGRGEATTIGVLLTLITQPMLIVGGVAISAIFFTRRVILEQGPFLFIPLPVVCWWLGVPGMLTAYGIALPCLVGFTHFLRTRRVVDTSGTEGA